MDRDYALAIISSIAGNASQKDIETVMERAGANIDGVVADVMAGRTTIAGLAHDIQKV
jgi:hypothetical protein